MKNFSLERIVPFVILGFSLVLAVILLIFMFYVFVWGAIVGFVLWGIVALKEKFFGENNPNAVVDVYQTIKGRVIEVDTFSEKNRAEEH